jgi:hypothetical protein
MEYWRHVWREGVAPQLSTPGLEALKKALGDDDPRLVQGATTIPPPLQCVQDWPVEGACAVSFCGWQDERPLVAQVEEFFAHVCLECDKAISEPSGVRHFLQWFDETARVEMREQLLPEVGRTLAGRYSEQK